MQPTISQWPLTAFEEYMLCDDRPAYPMTGVFRLRLSGILDRNAFESALNSVVSRHYLLRCTVRTKPGRRPCWIDNSAWRPTVEWDAQCNRYGYPNMSFMDLTKAPGGRFWIVERENSSDVVIQAHHSCTDAIGMCQVLEELLVLYARNMASPSRVGKLREIDPVRFPMRGSTGSAPKIALKLFDELLGAWQFLTRRPIPFTSKRTGLNESDLPDFFPASRTFELEEEETRLFFAAAKELGATVNNLLLRDLFLTVGAWRRENHEGNEQDWVRFAVPVNLRTEDDERLTMANCVSMVFPEQRMHDLSNSHQFLENLHKEMVLNNESKLKSTYISSIDIVRRIPRLLTFISGYIKCFSTCVFSNVGNVLNNTSLPLRDGKILAGNVVVEGIDLFPPLRRNTQLVVCVATYNKRLSLMLHFDPRCLSDDQGNGFLEKYVGKLRESIATVT